MRLYHAAFVIAMALTTEQSAFGADLKYATLEVETLVRGIASGVRDGKVLEVQSAALSKEYASNEVVADSKYLDRYLLVNAQVDSVQKDAFGAIVVRLRGTNDFVTNTAQFDKSVAVVDGLKKGAKEVSMQTLSEAGAAAQLAKGMKVKMLCKGKGYVLGAVQLRVCDVLYK